MKSIATRKFNICVIACIFAVIVIAAVAHSFAASYTVTDGSEEYTDDGYYTVRAYQSGQALSDRIKIVPTNSAFSYITNGGDCHIKRTPVQGLTPDSTGLEVYYDFNGDGRYTADELVKTATVNLPANIARVQDLEVAKAAVAEYGTNSYLADMFAIVLYVAQNFDYGYELGTYDCIRGAQILNLWNSYKGYDTTGSVTFAGYNNHYYYEGHDSEGEWFCIDCQGMKNKENYERWVNTAKRNMEFYRKLGI